MMESVFQQVSPVSLDSKTSINGRYRRGGGSSSDFGSTSDPPPHFDGTTRLYINHMCPYAQRVWIVRNYKGLYDNIKLVPIDLQNRPAWYREKVYPENKVPSLEHNDQVIGESLDLVKYIDSNFEGPALLPDHYRIRPSRNLLRS